MKYFNISETDILTSNIIMGCMRIINKSCTETEKLINEALELGINYFDHADIYGQNHACEKHFAKCVNMRSGLRDKMFLQTKCGITPCGYDFSKQHIIKQTEDSLLALNTDYIDVLLLHRPDVLMDPYEVGEAFEILKSSGKVKYFGVSNFNPMQIQLLQSGLNQKLVINQMQLSIAHSLLINEGMAVNINTEQGAVHTGGVLEYTRLKNMCLQTWSPFQYGFFGGSFLNSEKYPQLNKELGQLALKYNVTPAAIAVAWLLRIPQKTSVILGTTDVQHLKNAAMGTDIVLQRSEWYALYKAAGNDIP